MTNSAYGWKDEDLDLSVHTFVCEQCGMILDRDLNAAINLKSVAVSSTDTKNACGAESAGLSNGASETLCDEAGTKEDVWALSQMSLF